MTNFKHMTKDIEVSKRTVYNDLLYPAESLAASCYLCGIPIPYNCNGTKHLVFSSSEFGSLLSVLLFGTLFCNLP